MKNSDLPHIKQLLSDENELDLTRCSTMLEELAHEQSFTFEYIELPSIAGGKQPYLTDVHRS
jgi:hypothetical protein